MVVATRCKTLVHTDTWNHQSMGNTLVRKRCVITTRSTLNLLPLAPSTLGRNDLLWKEGISPLGMVIITLSSGVSLHQFPLEGGWQVNKRRIPRRLYIPGWYPNPARIKIFACPNPLAILSHCSTKVSRILLQGWTLLIELSSEWGEENEERSSLRRGIDHH